MVVCSPMRTSAPSWSSQRNSLVKKTIGPRFVSRSTTSTKRRVTEINDPGRIGWWYTLRWPPLSRRFPGSVPIYRGNTLVLETTNYNRQSPMLIVGPSNGTAGIPTSTEMKIVERFTPYGPGKLYYEAWVEDPVVLTGPFKIAYPWTRDDTYEPFEYACHEGNTLIWANIRSTSPRYAEWRERNFEETPVASE